MGGRVRPVASALSGEELEESNGAATSEDGQRAVLRTGVDVELPSASVEVFRLASREHRVLLESTFRCDVILTTSVGGVPGPVKSGCGEAAAYLRFLRYADAKAWTVRFGAVAKYRVVRIGRFSLQGMRPGELDVVRG